MRRGSERVLSLFVATSLAVALAPGRASAAEPTLIEPMPADQPQADVGAAVDLLMSDAASRMRLGDYDKALDQAAVAMSIATKAGDRMREHRIAILVGQWSWEAYQSNHALVHLDRCERILDQLGPASDVDVRVGQMAAVLRKQVEDERARIEAERHPPPPKMTTRPPANEGAHARDRRALRRAPAIALLTTGSGVLVASAILVGLGGSFFRGRPRADEAQAGRDCTNCERVGVGYTVAGGALAGVAIALIAVGARRLHVRRTGAQNKVAVRQFETR